jgi:hypothetical protein
VYFHSGDAFRCWNNTKFAVERVMAIVCACGSVSHLSSARAFLGCYVFENLTVHVLTCMEKGAVAVGLC